MRSAARRSPARAAFGSGVVKWSDADFHPTLMADGAAEAVGLILAADVRAGSVQST